MLKNLTLKHKNRLILAIAGLILVFTTYLAFALTMDSVYNEREMMAKRLTESAFSILERKHVLQQEGKLTLDVAQEQAINAIRSMRYGENGYIFVYRRDGTALAVGPKPEMEGNNYLDLTDPNGVKVIGDLVAVTHDGQGGYVHYHWPRPGDERPMPKVSYAQGFEPWDWFVGTGNYQVDMQSQVMALIQRKSGLVILAVVLFGAMATLLMTINRSTLAQILAVKEHLHAFEHGDFSTQIDVLSRDEIGDMLASMQQLQANMSATLCQFGQTIDAARLGDLSVRIPLEGKAGAYCELSNSVNQLIEISQHVVDDISRVLSAMARGNLDERIEREYQGSFAQLQRDTHHTIDALNQIINIEVQSLVDTATAGDLTQRIDMGDKAGFFANLSGSINTLFDAVDSLFVDLAETLKAMADGDLNQPIVNHYEGSFDSLKQDTNRTIDTIGKTVSQLLEAAEFLNHSAEEIDLGSTDLSSRTEQQAAALETTAASMEEISSMVQRNEENARQANDLASNARARVEKGDHVVGQAMSAMNDINASSSKISEIIGVIDELAFQTNLLALNASVEAARAGEQGRGFAVVADEVRNLAGRSAQAASEIKDLIEDSVAKVEVGVKLVNETGTTLEEIRSGVSEVEQTIAHIVHAGSEQAGGIEQVNRSIVGMDEVTQKNAALSHETSNAAAAMRTNAQEVRNLVSFFRIGAKQPDHMSRAA